MDKPNRKPAPAEKKSRKAGKAKSGPGRAEVASLYPRLIESFPDSLMYNDLNGTIILASRQAVLLHGYDHARDMIGMNSFDLIVPEDHPLVAQAIHRLMETENVCIEHTLLKKDGTRFQAEIRLALIRDESGQPCGIVAAARDLTERKLANAALRESEERYRRITVAITDYIYTVLIENNRIIETIHGPACYVVTGFTPEEFKSDVYLWINMVHEEDRGTVRRQAERMISGETPEPVEHRIWRRDGSLRWVRSTIVPHFDAEGRLISYDGLISDITERKLAQAALQDSEERYRMVSKLSVDYFFKVDMDADGKPRLSYVSENVMAITGRQQDEIKGIDQWINIIHPDDRAQFAAFYQKVLLERRGGQLECRSFLKSGAMRWVNVTVHPIVDAGSGAVTSIFGTVKDITERRLAEEKTRETQRQLEFIIGVTRTGIDIIDEDYNVLYVDPEWQKVYGDPKGKRCFEYFMDQSQVCPGCGIPKAFETRQGTVTEEILPRENNRVVEVHTIPFQNSSGKWLVAEFNMDITERKLAEERIRSSLREKETLLKEIHHRVKNNLQIITSLLNLQMQYLNNEELAEHFTEAENRIRSMALVHEKLYQSEDLGQIDFSLYISELADTIMYSYSTTAGKIVMNIDVLPVYLPVDMAIPAGLLITELLTNAIKYAFPPGWNGSPEVRISLRESSDGWVELIVSDNGIGLPEDAGLNGANTLGLSLVPMLAHQLNGEALLDRTNGTAYTITFRRQ